MSDPFNFQRFVDAQRSVRETVSLELRQGEKRTHWMWYAFPQIAGLGKSETAQYYALSSLEEARAYLAHPDLGPQLREWTDIVLGLDGVNAQDVFGPVDSLKFRSSMTLFALAEGPDSPFQRALGKYYDGEPCPRTSELCG